MEPLVVIAGPTGVGKSDLAVKLAKRINGEIISADSMQVYKRMNIGSAKITLEEMDGIKHYLIDVLEPSEDFNVFSFQKLAKEAVNEIINKGKIPIVCGGTGFYLQSLLYDIDFSESEGENTEKRQELYRELEELGPEKFHEKLKDIDPVSYEKIHPNNTMRVVRAIEFYNETHTPISAHNEEQRKRESVYNSAFFVLNDTREKVYERIDRRVDKMMEKGLVDEVKGLKAEGLTTANISMLGLGYKEILDYLEKNITLEEAVSKIKQGTRHFAKRQVTWFKREKDVIWLNRNELGNDEQILDYCLKVLADKQIIRG